MEIIYLYSRWLCCLICLVLLPLPGLGAVLTSTGIDSLATRVDTVAADRAPELTSDEEPYYFYKHLGYGSDSLVHPLRLIINGGYGIMQIENRHNRPQDIHYDLGFRNVVRNLGDPISAIEVNGWWDFINREILPIGLDPDKAQYWPNYMQHLIGGGMSYRMMVEWFRYRDYGHPKLWAGTTIFFYHLLNEVVENDRRDTYNTDPIADLYIFDPLSMVLFSSERVCRFFSHTLHMTDWSYQPMWDPHRKTFGEQRPELRHQAGPAPHPALEPVLPLGHPRRGRLLLHAGKRGLSLGRGGLEGE
ncbi:MAG: hypothetical protein ABIF77_11670 [bacterium]